MKTEADAEHWRASVAKKDNYHGHHNHDNYKVSDALRSLCEVFKYWIACGDEKTFAPISINLTNLLTYELLEDDVAYALPYFVFVLLFHEKD